MIEIYRGVPVIERDLVNVRGETVNGRFIWPIPVIFINKQLKEGDTRERVKLHEWLHVVQCLYPAIPFVMLFVAMLFGETVSVHLISVDGAVALVPHLLRLTSKTFQVEMEAMAKGAEVAAGNDLYQEARGLAFSGSYPNTFGLEYCVGRIKWWAKIFGMKG